MTRFFSNFSFYLSNPPRLPIKSRNSFVIYLFREDFRVIIQTFLLSTPLCITTWSWVFFYNLRLSVMINLPQLFWPFSTERILKYFHIGINFAEIFGGGGVVVQWLVSLPLDRPTWVRITARASPQCGLRGGRSPVLGTCATFNATAANWKRWRMSRWR